MPGTQPAKKSHLLCYEHHQEMTFHASQTQGQGPAVPGGSYACPIPDCGVHYSASEGYFLANQNGHGDLMPRVKCAADGSPMYLAETNPQKTSYRLWKCPECNSIHTNEDNLVAGTSEKSVPA